ncbi:MAG: adenosylmethionine decarboxylase [Actinomycetota bacterium]
MNALGRHFLIELWDAQNLDKPEAGEEALVETVRATGATLLDTRFVPFPNGGYSGVCILAESHISIHTWPEHGYAAVDTFTCGPNMDFDSGMDVLKKHFDPKQMQVAEVRRGLIV